MRNLKRALSLALASVMLLGMMVVGTSASYPDVTSKNNEEAIEVLKAVGVMTGDEKGNFNPDKTVTRNEMAVIMTKLLDLKTKDYAGSCPLTDVPAWAEPYVAACYANGIVSGTSATTYSGDATVTAAQAALMMQKALGYFQYSSDFGDDWMVSTVKQASKIDLFKGIDVSATAPLTRNDVAQLALNTLKATMVEADDNGIGVNPDGQLVSKYKYVELYKAASKYTKIKAGTPVDSKYTVELGEELYDGKLELDATTGSMDDFGRPGNKWTYPTTSDEIGTYASSADVKVVLTDDYSSKTAIDDVLEAELDKKAGTYDVATSVSYYLNGDDKTNFDGVKASLKEGTVVEVFYNDNNKIKAVAAYNYSVDKITDVDTDVSTADKKDDVTAYVEFDNLGSVRDTKITGYNAKTFVKDAWIAYVENANHELIEAYPATVVEGSISTIKAGDYLTIDGTKYSIAAQAATGLNALSVKKDDTYKVFVDKNGFAIGSDEVTSSTKLTDVYHVDQVWVEHDSKFNGTDNYYAQIVALDGTVQEIALENLAKGGNKTTDTYDTATYEGQLVTISDKKWTDSKAPAGEHKANDKKYDLETYTSNSDYDVDTSLTFGQFKKDTTRMTIGGTTYRFNDKTQYVMIAKTGADLTITVKTGGVALATGKTGTIITEKDKSVALYVLVISNSKISETSTFDGDNLIYIKSESQVKGDGYRVQDVYTADGKKTQMNVDESEYPTDGTKLDGKFYAYDTNDDGYIVLSADDAKALTIADANGVWDDEEGVVYGVKYISLFNDLLTVKDSSSKTYADINVSNVKFVDLHETDTDKNVKTYDRTVNTLKALDNIMTKDGNQYTVTELNMSVSKDGAIVIFLTKLEKA